MGIFDKIFGKKGCCCSAGAEIKEEIKAQETICSCGGTCDTTSEEKKFEIRVLGSGCSSCQTLEKNVKEAVEELGIEAKIVHITDFSEIATYGIISTPGLWIDGKVVSFGKVLSKDEIKTLLKTR